MARTVRYIDVSPPVVDVVTIVSCPTSTNGAVALLHGELYGWLRDRRNTAGTIKGIGVDGLTDERAATLVLEGG